MTCFVREKIGGGPAVCRTELFDSMTIFEKIVAREIPAKIVLEDDEVRFSRVDPKAPVHV